MPRSAKRFMSDVAEGVVYVNGERMKRATRRLPPDFRLHTY
jgi:ribosome-associated protein YbcJ (S4-like RNA binding protein)